MASLRHTTIYSLHAHLPADVLLLSDGKYHSLGPIMIGNEDFYGRHPDGEENMLLMQHIDLYWPH
ncbi:UNVERIFIED_CONTAM: hypothetical protein Sradi_6467200 [Sesamum radiatum]|uniref:Uncharacterized protein n=1 Tax=Sesamum radiatum TaxID=300843 RepID=A0AAW2K503_SESRA